MTVNQTDQLFQQKLQTTDQDKLVLLSEQRDQLGLVHQKYQQQFNSIPVEGRTVTVHSRNGKITHLTGNFKPLEGIDINPSISGATGLQQAMEHVAATKYAWEGDELVHHASHAGHEDHGFVKPEGELVIFAHPYDKTLVRLAYKYDIYASEPLYRAYVYVDAQDGKVLFENHRIHNTDTNGSCATLYNGTQNVTVDNTGSNYRLRQTADGNGIETYDMNNGTNYNNATDVTNNTPNFGSGTATAGQAHFGAERTHQYFMQKHNRNSYNGNGAVIKSYVSYSSNYVNAFWNGSVMTYGDGDGVNYGPLVSLDIVGHEITHGVTEYTANLVYSYESGALNESFSDIFGESIENFALGSNDWLMGDDIGIGGSGAIRSMSNPNAFGDPDTYQGSYWATGSGDNGGVHTNSGVQNKWFYILSVGENGTNDNNDSYNVAGIGIGAAEAIAYRNLSVYLSSNSNYADARAGAIQSAIDLYGAGSNEEIQTTNAWYAVGVGAEYGGGGPMTCVEEAVTLTIVLDNYPEETSWTIKQGATTVESGGTYGSQPDGSTVVVNMTLPAGEYTFTINDSYGDGICCGYGSGSYSLDAASGNIASGGAFGSSASTDFCTEAAGGGGDTEAPSDPTNLSASNITTTTFDLNWNASTDNVGVTGYNIFIGGTNIGSVAGNSANITGAAPSTTYSCYVQAFDAAGNVSGNSNTINVTTLSDGCADADSDGICDVDDNCPNDANPDQADVDGDGIGDVCDSCTDVDNDGVCSDVDCDDNDGSVGAQQTPGTSCDDGDANTENDVIQGDGCTCAGTPIGGGGSDEIFGHFFESGWNGWSDGGSDCYRYYGSRSWEGNYSIRIRDNSGTASSMTSSAYDLSAYSSADVEFYFYPNSMETGEDFWLQVKNGTGPWTTVASYVSGSSFSNNSFYTSTVNVTDLSSSTKFRFRCDASSNADRVYIDAVTVTAHTGASFMENTTTITELSQPTPDYNLDFDQDVEGDEYAEVSVYPNPAHNLLNIKANDMMEEVRIYSVNGNLVKAVDMGDEHDEVDISQLISGLYYISVKTDSGVVIKKFVKR